MIAFKAGPALERIMVPGASGHILIHVQVAMCQDVESCALLIGDQDGHSVLKFLAKAHVEHAGVERTAPHTYVTPAWARERACSRARKDQIGSGGEHGFLRKARLYVAAKQCAVESWGNHMRTCRRC